MKIAIIGAGHVGLVTGAALSSLGHDAVCMDISVEKVAGLARGEAPFREPGLDELLTMGLRTASLHFTTSMVEAVGGAEVVFVCVGRPPVGDGDASLIAVEAAVRGVAANASDGVVVVLKSTVPPGTTERVTEIIGRERPDLTFSTVSSPEFLREGHAIEDTLRPDRMVIGTGDERAIATFRHLYASIIEDGHPLVVTDSRTAELSKLASNAFLATKISFANGLAHLCELVGADVTGVTRIMGADPRIGSAFLAAGLGFGGYCLPKDSATLESVAARFGFDFGIVREARRLNDQALDAVRRKIEDVVWNLEGKRIAVLGLAFKPGTDDVRGSPALALVSWLLSEGAIVVGHDPLAGENAVAVEPRLEIALSPYEAASASDCVVVCTEWSAYGDLDLTRLRQVVSHPAIVDGRNVLNPRAVTEAGFAYLSVGRAVSDAVLQPVD